MFQALLTITLQICLFHQGEVVPNSIIRKSRPISAVQWHPIKKVLAIGWETGELCIRNEHERELYEVPLVHKAEITILQWSSTGSRLVTGDSVSDFLWCHFILPSKVSLCTRVSRCEPSTCTMVNMLCLS